MRRIQAFIGISALLVCVALAGCGNGTNQFGSQGGNNGNSSVVLAMTDSAPTGVSILSAKVTLTGATLAPGNVSLFSGQRIVELTRLQTDVAYIATATKIPAGTYTSVTLTFANPSLTIENDTGNTIAGCALGAICTIVRPPSTMSATVPFSSFSIASSSTAGLLIDVSLDKLLNVTLGADFSAGTSVFPFTPTGTNAPLVGAEDVVGQVTNLSASSDTFTLTNADTLPNAEATYSLKVSNSSTFFQFPTSLSCTSPTFGFACLANNQILSVDIGIQADGSLLARNIVFEDANSSDAEVEGIVTGTNAGLSQFSIVVLTASATGTGLSVGGQATVQYSISTSFDVDFVHADNSAIDASSFLSSFTGPAELVPGQQVSIRRGSSSSGSVIMADRVRLRSSRVTGNVQSEAAPLITLNSLPLLYSKQSNVTAIQARTSTSTIYYEVNGSINSTTDLTNQTVSVRGPLFNSGGNNRTLLATKVVLK